MERTVLVTGAGSGIGLATACHLADLGFTVVGLVPDVDEARSLTDAVAQTGNDARAVVADLIDPDARARAVDGLRLYALINNAGYMNAGLLRDIPLEDARAQLEAMVVAPLDLARRVLPHMLERGEGRLVQVTSAAVHTATPFTGWYQAAKAALRELSDALRLELAGTGVDVVEIEPGGIATNIWSRAAVELRHRRTGSWRPEVYERPLRMIDRFEGLAPDPTVVARRIGAVLTSGKPRPHQRIGLQAAVMRATSEVLPERVQARLSAAVTKVR